MQGFQKRFQLPGVLWPEQAPLPLKEMRQLPAKALTYP